MTTSRTPRSFRPQVQRLEDRAVPAFGLGWAINYGGIGANNATNKGIGIALDGSGGVYVSGMYTGTVDFDPNDTNPAASQVLTATGYYGNNFAAKYLADGTFQWVTELGVTAQGAPGETIAVQGAAVFVGYPTATPAVDIDDAAAVSRLDAATGAVSWTTTLTSGGSTRVNVAAGPAGSVYAAGDVATSQLFVSRLNATGNLTWTTTSSVVSRTRAIGLAVDAAGNAYATGEYTGTMTLGDRSLTSWAGTADAYVWKVDAVGGTTWAGSMGSNGTDFGEGIALDGAGNVVVTGMWGAGSTASKNNFNPNPGTAVRLTNQGGFDCYVAKLAPAANGGLTLTWAKNIGGTADSRGLAVATDTAGNIYTTGSYTGTANFNPNNSGKRSERNLTSSGGSTDIFVSKLTSTGNYADAVAFGSTGVDFGRSITTDVAGNVYAIGVFPGTADFDPTAGTYNLTANSQQDIVVLKLSQGSPLLAAAGPAGGDKAVRLTAAQLAPIIDAAVQRWAAAGLDPIRLDVLRHASVTIADLGGSYLGLANADTHAIRIDDDAAGYGWFVDATPRDDSEFRTPRDRRVRGRMDLLSVIAHELGHLVGLDDDHEAGHATDVMGDSLAAGTRRLPTFDDVRDATTVDPGHLADFARSRPVRRR